MREREYEFSCTSCGVEFTLITTTDEEPASCPFCIEDLDTDREKDELEDE